MGFIGREKLLEKEKLLIEKVDLGNDEHVFVRQMTGHERDLFEASTMSPVMNENGDIVDYRQELDDFRAKLAVQTVCDESGNLVFGANDYISLSKSISAPRLMKIASAAQKINRITREEQKKILKNSGGGQDAASHSDFVKS